MTRKKLIKETQEILESLFDIKYVDGQPVKVKKDPLKELRQELEPTEDANPFDATKRALYADLPQAEIKRDKSMTARELNSTLESVKQRNETQFTLAQLKMLNAPYCTIYAGKDLTGAPEWAFKWNFKDATISTVKKPDNGYDITWKSSKFSKFDKSLLPEIYKKLEEHIKHRKV